MESKAGFFRVLSCFFLKAELWFTSGCWRFVVRFRFFPRSWVVIPSLLDHQVARPPATIQLIIDWHGRDGAAGYFLKIIFTICLDNNKSKFVYRYVWHCLGAKDMNMRVMDVEQNPGFLDGNRVKKRQADEVSLRLDFTKQTSYPNSFTRTSQCMTSITSWDCLKRFKTTLRYPRY